MKTIESKDLVIGQEYYDIPDYDLENATVFEFIGHHNGEDIFEYVRGNNAYNLEIGQIINFPPDHYYQP